MAKNHFDKPFDDGTKVKLEIFRNYLVEWLPVFISNYEKTHWENIFIYDFFSGEGKDCEGTYGSPLIILDVLNEFKSLISTTKVKVNIVFNEKEEKTFNKLKSNINAFSYNKEKITIHLYNKPFQDLFLELYPKMIIHDALPKLMILDQFGIKEILYFLFLHLLLEGLMNLQSSKHIYLLAKKILKILSHFILIKLCSIFINHWSPRTICWLHFQLKRG